MAIVSERIVRECFPGGPGEALGRRVRVNVIDRGEWLTVVGVVADIRQMSLDQDVQPMIYVPFQQDHSGFLRFVAFVARTSTPGSVVEGIRAEIRRAAPDLPIQSTVTMDEAVAASVAQPRFRMVLLGLFAMTATLIATCGLYGLMAYAVTQRRREIGVRMALGADRRDVLRLVLTRALRIVVAGLIVGLAGAAGVTRVLQTVPVRGDADRSDRVHDRHAAAVGGGTDGGMAARAPRDTDRPVGRAARGIAERISQIRMPHVKQRERAAGRRSAIWGLRPQTPNAVARGDPVLPAPLLASAKATARPRRRAFGAKTGRRLASLRSLAPLPRRSAKLRFESRAVKACRDGVELSRFWQECQLMRRVTAILSVAAVVLVAAGVVAQAKPSFAGEWKISLRSDSSGWSDQLETIEVSGCVSQSRDGGSNPRPGTIRLRSRRIAARATARCRAEAFGEGGILRSPETWASWDGKPTFSHNSREGLDRRQRATRDDLRQRRALDQLHHEIVRPDVVERADVGRSSAATARASPRTVR